MSHHDQQAEAVTKGRKTRSYVHVMGPPADDGGGVAPDAAFCSSASPMKPDEPLPVVYHLEAFRAGDDLAVLLAKWQPLLRLADWDIEAKYERHAGRSGVIRHVEYKQAWITVIDPLDYRGEDRAGRPYDAERELLHELCHLHFAFFATDNAPDPKGIAEEQAVVAFTHALITLDRRPGPIAPTPIAAPTPTRKRRPRP